MEGPQQEKKKVPENFEQAADMLIQKGDAIMRQNHGLQGDEKVYHTLENHIDPFQKRAKEIADALGLNQEQQKLISIIISWHDTVIDYDKPDPENIVGMVRRHRGAREGDNKAMGEKGGTNGNEARSAKDMVQAMKETGQCTQDQIDTAQFGVDVTYPDVALGPDFQGAAFTQDPLYEQIVASNPRIAEMVAFLNEQGITKGPHFFQPHLENELRNQKKIPEEVLVVALGDLGAAGCSRNPEQFFVEGDNEAKESYHNIRQPENLERLLTGDGEKDQEDRKKASGALFGWLHSQSGFAMWQMIRFEKILYWLRENGQFDHAKEQQLRSVVQYYEADIKASVERDLRIKAEYDSRISKQGDKAAFDYLAQEMNYKS